MAKKVAEIFIETLVNAGVKRVYGVVGDSLNGLTDVIRKSNQIEWLHVRHEEVAAFAAGAEHSRSATSPGITTTATPRLVRAVRMAIPSTLGICSGCETSSQ